MDIRTIADLRRTARTTGNHFFSKGALSFFQSRIDSTLYRVSDTVGYFVTSERYGDDAPRLYRVRRYEWDGSRLTIDVANDREFDTLQAAREYAKAIRKEEVGA